MKAIQLQTYEINNVKHPKISLVNTNNPVPKRGFILVKTHYCGICGTDFLLCKQGQEIGGGSFRGPLNTPIILGHEFSGIVVDNGGDNRFPIGVPVVAESIIACGQCRSCRRGMRDACEHIELIGLTQDGAFAEHVLVPSHACWKIEYNNANHLDTDTFMMAGALLEPLGCAYNALFCCQGAFYPGCTVCILGASVIGVGAAMLAGIAGASSIICIDLNEIRLKWAKNILQKHKSITSFIQYTDGNIITEHIYQITKGRGVDIHLLIDASIPSPPKYTLDTISTSGRLIILNRVTLDGGIQTDNLINLSAGIIGIRGHSGHNAFGRIVQLFECGLIEPEKFVSQVISIEDAVNLLSTYCNAPIVPGRALVKLDL